MLDNCQFSCPKMSSKEKLLRERIVQFYERHKIIGKMFTVEHFLKEGISRSTIYDILKRGIIERKQGSGRKPTIMTQKNLKRMKTRFNNKDGVSQGDVARIFGCSQQYISKSLKKLQVKARKKQKSPAYTESQIAKLKKDYRYLVRDFEDKNFILDDE